MFDWFRNTDWWAVYEWVRTWLKDWQTLVAGLLALTGAAATIASVKRQIASSESIERNRRRDEAYAARAVLPLALSEMSSYAESCVRILAVAAVAPSPATKAIQLRQLPSPPADIIPAFKEAIRFSEPNKQHELADLLAWYQVHEARLAPLRFGPQHGASMVAETAQGILDAVELHIKAADLFAWARGEGRPSRVDDYNRLHRHIDLHVENFREVPHLDALLNARRPKTDVP